MAKKGANTVARLEFVVIIIFFIGFIIWAMGRCERTQETYADEAAHNAELDSLDAVSAAAEETLQIPTPSQQTRTASDGPPVIRRDTIGTGPARIIRETRTPLYVTIDGMNMRRGPGLNFDIIDRLPLFAEVYFLNEVTDSLHEIVLGEITTREPWVKVKTERGKVGWLYGAGVSYYKRKLEGVDN